MDISKRILTLFLLSLLAIAHCEEPDMDDNDDEGDDDEDGIDDGMNNGEGGGPPPGYKSENVMKFEAPQISDEEAHNFRLPSNLLCDGCMAISYQLGTALEALHDNYRHRKKNKNAPESEVIEVVEKACSKSVFESYGIKSMNGVNRLSGPGTDAKDEPGMMQGGGRWPFRLSMICGEMVGETDEYDLYNKVVNEGASQLHKYLCENPTIKAFAACRKRDKTEL